VLFKTNKDFAYIDLSEDQNIETSQATTKIRTGYDFENTFLEEENEEYPFTIKFKNIEALDARSAINLAEVNMRFLASLLNYNIHKGDFSWQNKVLAYELPHNYPWVIDPTVKAVHKRPDKKLEEIPEATKKIINLISNGPFNDKSIRLFWALKLHSEAISAKTEENQLLTFWSSIEGILSPPSDVGRIDYILRSIVPLLVADYPKKLIFDMQKIGEIGRAGGNGDNR
jgi:hypothetical protein